MKKHLRFFFRLTKAFIQRHFFTVFFGCLLGIFAFYIFPHFSLPISHRKEIKIGIVGRYEENLVSEEITQLVSLGLTKLMSEGTATSSLAKSWEINDQGKVYKFYLRDDVLWQDGTQFTAKDISYEFKNAKIQVLSDFQIKIVLNEPFSALPTLVSKPILKKDKIGVGDYQIIRTKRAGRFLEKVKLAPVNKKTLPDLNYHFYTTEEAARIGFKLGEVHVLKEILSPGELANWPEIKVSPNIHQERYAAVFFNLKNPKFANKSFRQALAYAIEKQQGETRAYGPLHPLSWAYNSKLKPYLKNLDHAKELLDKEKYDNSITLFAFPSLIAQAEKISQDWESLGIATEVKIVNSLPEKFETLLAIWEIPADPDQYAFWHSTQAGNITGITNPKIDKFLEEGRRTFDLEKRKENYLEFQKTLVEECPAIFLFHPVTYTIMR